MNKGLTLLTNMYTNLDITDMETCYKAFKADILKDININSNRFDFEPEITAKIVKKGAKIMNFITFGKAIDKKAAKEIADVKVTDMVFGAFCSILDGSLVKHEEGSAYYTVFTQALALPLKIVKKLRIKNGGLIRTLTHIKDAAHEIMTGGPLDNNNWFCEF